MPGQLLLMRQLVLRDLTEPPTEAPVHKQAHNLLEQVVVEGAQEEVVVEELVELSGLPTTAQVDPESAHIQLLHGRDLVADKDQMDIPVLKLELLMGMEVVVVGSVMEAHMD